MTALEERTSHGRARARQPRRRRALVVLTELIGPVPLGIVLLLWEGWRFADSHVVGLAWGAAAAVGPILIPGPIALRARRTSGGHTTAAQRVGYMTTAVLTATGSLLTIALLGAPRQLVGTVVVMLSTLLVAAVVNRWWRLSNHTTLASAGVPILGLLVGWLPALVGLAALVLLGWTRLALGKHDLGQVTVGAVVGMACAAAIFPAFL